MLRGTPGSFAAGGWAPTALAAVGLLASAGSAAPPPANGEPASGGPALHGLALQVDRADGLVDRYAAALREIVELGANCVLISPNLYQAHAGSDRVRADPQRTPPPEELRHLLELARALGLRVVLMPKVLLSAPRGNEWRGRIAPPSWDDWFDQYRRHIVDIARTAERARAEVLLVGSELVSTERFTEPWRRIIADVRAVYGGRLGYSANWDHYETIEFWDDLDLIGLTTYHKLADEPNPSVELLVRNWQPIRERILTWQRARDRPILFTEVGWCSQEGAAMEAWNYYRGKRATPAALEEQQNLYEAFIRVWGSEPCVGGLIWWEWTTHGGGPDDYGYTPRGKPAERVLRRWWASRRTIGHPAGVRAADSQR